MLTYRRRLPHIYPQGKWIFVTWSLHGALPVGRYPPAGKTRDGRAFVWMDRYLDTTSVGPLYLRQPAIAQVVVNSLLRGVEEGHYELGAYAVMPNHVHTLLLPKVPPSQLMRALKGVTAREANRILNRTGQSFWQGESYDHWVRDQTEWDRIAKYIEENPVKAGLAVRAEAYPWSSAGGEAPCVGTSADAAGTSARATSHEKIT